MSNKETVKLSVHLSPEAYEELERLSEEGHTTKSEILRKSLALISVAMKYKKKGKHLVVVNDQGEKESEIIGL